MKIVFVKHYGEARKYVFEVPGKNEVKTGDSILVDTKRGVCAAVAASDSFDVEEKLAAEIADATGGKMPLKKVVGVYHLLKFEE